MRAWRKRLQQRRNVGTCLSSCHFKKHNFIKLLRAILDESTLSGHDVLRALPPKISPLLQEDLSAEKRPKGEALHDLRAYLFIANRGQLRRRRGEELAHQANCLNLVTNAVMVWNTVYMTAVVEQLKQEGYPMQGSDLAHIWATRYNHINVYGKSVLSG
jgi:hypothetical protein